LAADATEKNNKPLDMDREKVLAGGLKAGSMTN
jgi:hypothetical protein